MYHPAMIYLTRPIIIGVWTGSGPRRCPRPFHEPQDIPRPAIISKLSAEILSVIFDHVYLFGLLDHSSHKNPYKPLYLVAQVCRTWRDACFGTPRLWSHIDGQVAPIYAELLLARSKATRFHFDCRIYPNPRVVDMVFQNAHRLETMDIHLKHRHDATIFNSISRLIDAPLLERLRLQYHPDYIVGSPPFELIHFTHSVTLRTSPPLRHLSLSDCFLDLRMPLFSHLRSLKILMSFPMNDSLPTIRLFSALKGMHYLETLEVSYIAERSNTHHGTKAFLPFLTKITMQSVGITALNIIPRLRCPAIQRVTLSPFNPLSAASIHPIVSAVYDMIPRVSPWHVEAIMEPTASYCHTVFLIWPGPKTDERLPPFMLNMSGPNTFEVEQLLCSILPPSAKLELHFRQFISSGEKLNTVFLKPFLRTLKNVEEVHASACADLISLISDTPQVSKKTQAGILPEFALPSLSVICFDLPYFKPPCLKLKRIASLLARRKQIGAGITKLKLPDYGPPRFVFHHALPVAEELDAWVGTIERSNETLVKYLDDYRLASLIKS